MDDGMKNVKIAYIGGGSKAWARVFMMDLALSEGFCGEIALYDIDVPAVELNQKLERESISPLKRFPNGNIEFIRKSARRWMEQILWHVLFYLGHLMKCREMSIFLKNMEFISQ